MFRQICAFGLMVLVSMPAMALKIGEKAPDFKLTDTNGTSHSLSQNKGKWVVLEWYNPGCPFVVRHYKKKTMTTLASEFGARGVEWLAVDSSHFVTSTSGADFQAKHQITTRSSMPTGRSANSTARRRRRICMSSIRRAHFAMSALLMMIHGVKRPRRTTCATR